MKIVVTFIFVSTFMATLFGCASAKRNNSGESLTCSQHEDVAKSLNRWAAVNFEEGYGKKGDLDGALVQLFLIEEDAPSPYASSFNRFQEKSAENISLATKKNCDTSEYPLPPIDEFKARLSSIEKK